ncbi:nucleotidyltransferase domain-containing protein [Catellatospora vulcania]|uniref:nucleotidyltransferase domain-containing protein n=1 Tax=Catellatospora vulcania TaxID=1460450 RepID=UPI0012D45820|nr:aminoglycoside adenylyltransferase [Catellatospora vulcania]
MDFRAQLQLAAVAEITACAARDGIALWLRGGWAMDFHLGRITRPHADVDWFCWAADADRLTSVLAGLGFTGYGEHDPRVQRDFLRDGVDLGVALLGRDGEGHVVVPAGPYAGARWPDGMLDGPPGHLNGLSCPVISPQAQLEIKKMMPVWVPGLPRRDKDLADIALLAGALRNTPQVGNGVAGA